MGAAQNTSLRQDVAMINAVLALCASRKVTPSILPLFLTPTHGELLDGHPIESDPATHDEKLRARRFGQYCDDVREFVVATRFCQPVRETRDMGAGPREVQWLRPTRLGRIYAAMPAGLQLATVSVLAKAVWIAGLLRSYKWLGIVVTGVTLAVGWVSARALSAAFAAMAVLLGVGAMLLANWLHAEEPANGSPSPDDTLW